MLRPSTLAQPLAHPDPIQKHPAMEKLEVCNVSRWFRDASCEPVERSGFCAQKRSQAAFATEQREKA